MVVLDKKKSQEKVYAQTVYKTMITSGLLIATLILLTTEPTIFVILNAEVASQDSVMALQMKQKITWS